MKSEKKEKRRWGDRKDAYLVRDVDSMHYCMPLMLGGRTENEAVLNETVDLTAIENYLAKKNYEGIDFKYTFFHVITAAVAKAIVLRPKLNYFYSGNKLWERKDITLSFVIKKQFNDNSTEDLAIITCPKKEISPVEFIHDEVKKNVQHVRGENQNNKSGDIMDIFKKMPRFVAKMIFNFLKWLERRGWYPQAVMEGDPYYSSCFITNLGSIKMHAQYHHLAEWGTNSLFLIIGEKKPMPFYSLDGSFRVANALDLGVTVDERIADGLYFANSIRIVKHLLEHPELLELPIETPVELDK